MNEPPAGTKTGQAGSKLLVMLFYSHFLGEFWFLFDFFVSQTFTQDSLIGIPVAGCEGSCFSKGDFCSVHCCLLW